ncbi:MULTISPECIES: BglG family transcription antiterminator [unclassified Granulicatella]|uniref:BglG family transcription antiterminator n=1 Tax=unclassified Granulicatella TaxID=2630493 RepID=UPI00107458C7|nr:MULTISPECIES: BglG family transcription antiterminator [unclassified Granulicatella]MBF0779888.1 BglG family transcription antiterminator [Granulicatella sp. 19428wC4_WM01]TFU96092.1 BglG family transcription antiterminator [Granulicatella sp. WM01]
MLDNSLMTLLKHILENPTITVHSFLDIHHLSQRQFQLKLKQLNDYLHTLHLAPISIENQVFVYDKQLENFLLQDDFYNEKNILFEEDMRIYTIYLYTFIRQETISNFHFQWLMQVSKNTVLSDMKHVRNMCLKHHVQFGYTRKKGYHLNGTEMDKRYVAMICLNHLLSYSIGKKIIYHLVKSWQIDPFLDDISQSIKSCLKEDNWRVPPSRLELLTFFYQLILIRDSSTLSFSDKQLHVLTKHELLHTTRRIADRLNIHHTMEVYYLTAHLLAVVEGNTLEHTQKLHHHIHYMIDYIERHMVVHFDKQLDLYKGLCLHLLPTYYRILFDIPIHNSLTELIISDYPFLFDMVKRSLIPLEHELNKSFSADEVAFLTMFFGGKLKQNFPTQSTLHALVICPNGISASNMLKTQLEQLFPTFQWSVSAHMEHYDLTHVHMIFSTIFMKAPIPVYVTKPILSIHEKNYLIDVVNKDFNVTTSKLPTSQDIIALVEKHATILDYAHLEQDLDCYIRQHAYIERKENPMLKDLIRPEYIHFSTDTLSWQEAIQLSCAPLETYGHITPQYAEAIIERVKTFGPYIHIGKGVAIPHARPEDGVKKIGMSLLKLHTPVQLDNMAEHTVDVFITLAAIDNTTHLNALSELTKILSDTHKLEQLKQAKTTQDVLHIINHTQEENK